MVKNYHYGPILDYIKWVVRKHDTVDATETTTNEFNKIYLINNDKRTNYQKPQKDDISADGSTKSFKLIRT